MSKKTLMDFFQLRKKSINPKKYPDSLFTVYSLPAFDNHKTPEIIKGALIESNKDIMAADTILFNKLNIRFKRVWNIKEIQDNAVCSWEFLQIEPKNCDQDFLYYFLLSDSITTFLDGASGWTSHSHSRIKPEDLLNIKVNFPPINKQKEIGSILSAIDSKIEINNKINAELESMAKAIYDYWFVQFDFPDENGKPYKSSGGKMVWNEELKREIPEGWRCLELSEVISRSGTWLNPRDNFKLWTGDNYYVTIKNIDNGKVIIDDRCDKIDDNALEIINKRSDLRPGDVLFTSIEPIGVTYLIQEKPKNWNINESVFTIRAQYEKVSPEYLYMLLSSEEMRAFTKNASTGSIHKGIRHGVLKTFRLAYGGFNHVEIFTKRISPILRKSYLLDIENQELSNLRDWLLPMLMNGQVTVSK